MSKIIGIDLGTTNSCVSVMEGGEAVELENYTAPQLPEGAEGNVGVQSLEPGADGTLWVTEYMYAYTFYLPEGFNAETDDQWAYQNYKESMIRRQLDATGNELTRLDMDGLMEKLEMEYISGMAFDRDGNSYVLLDGEIAVLDPQLNTLFSVEEENLWGRMTLLADGSIGVLYSAYDQETETSTNQLRVIDRELPEKAKCGRKTAMDYSMRRKNLCLMYQK